MSEQRFIEVVADWAELGGPTLMGHLTATPERGKEVFAFEYDEPRTLPRGPGPHAASVSCRRDMVQPIAPWSSHGSGTGLTLVIQRLAWIFRTATNVSRLALSQILATIGEIHSRCGRLGGLRDCNRRARKQILAELRALARG